MQQVSYKLMETWSARQPEQGISQHERQTQLESICELSAVPFPEGCANNLCEMIWHEELLVAIVWLCLFSSLLYGPFVIVFLLWWRMQIGVLVCALLFGISMFGPSTFSKTACYSYIATLMLKYFSFRGK